LQASAPYDANTLSDQYHQASPTEGVGHETEFNRESLRDGSDRGSVHVTDTDASNASHTSVTDAAAASQANQDGVRRSVQRRKAPQRLRDNAFPVAFSSQVDREALYYQNYGEKALQAEMQDPLAFAAKSSDPDTFHYGIAMKQPD
jgi:hypothetical protein